MTGGTLPIFVGDRLLHHSYLYLMVANEPGTRQFVKVGIARDPRARTTDVQVGSPLTIHTMFCTPILKARKAEKHLHHLLRSRHVRGEWFWTTSADPFEDELFVKALAAAHKALGIAPNRWERIDPAKYSEIVRREAVEKCKKTKLRNKAIFVPSSAAVYRRHAADREETRRFLEQMRRDEAA